MDFFLSFCFRGSLSLLRCQRQASFSYILTSLIFCLGDRIFWHKSNFWLVSNIRSSRHCYNPCRSFVWQYLTNVPLACSAGGFGGFHLSFRVLSRHFGFVVDWAPPQLSTVFLIQDGGLNSRWEYPLAPVKIRLHRRLVCHSSLITSNPSRHNSYDINCSKRKLNWQISWSYCNFEKLDTNRTTWTVFSIVFATMLGSTLSF